MTWKKTSFVIVSLWFACGPALVDAAVTYEYKEYKSLIGRQKSANYRLRTGRPFIGITSHHLPTASPLIDTFYYQLKKKRPDIKTFVVIGPDHSERCRQKFSIKSLPVMTMYGELRTDKALASRLAEAGAKREEACFEGEHAIGVQANYIKRFFPEAKMVPVLLSYAAKQRSFEALIKELASNRNDVFVVASVDFSHYLEVQKAEAVDAISRKMINELDGTSFSLKQIDSPATIKVILGLARALQLKPEIIEHRNSFDYNGAYKNTTSYFSVVF